MTQTRQELAVRFRNSVDEQLQDIALLDDGHRLTFFYDTSDVRDAALGMLAFHSHGRGFWRIRDIRDRRTTVQTLVASRWLGPFSLLPPHQSEFLELLNVGFNIGSRRVDRLAFEFLESAGVGRPRRNGHAELDMEEMSEDELRDYVHKQAGQAELFFKAVHCINASWYARLREWQAQELLEAREYRLDYATILGSDAFERLRDAFDRLRPDRSLNNFTDAAAVATLVELARRCRDGESDEVPRFYMSSAVFRDAIQAAGIEGLLEFETPKGLPVTVLRDADYYVMRASFLTRPPDLPAPSRASARAELQTLRDQMDSFLRAQEVLGEQTSLGDEQFSDLVEALERFSFLEKVWLTTLSARELKTALLKVAEAARQMADPKFKEQVKEESRQTRDQFAVHSEGYRRAFQLWKALDGFADAVPPSLRTAAANGLDLLAHYGLLRFSLPEETHEEVSSVLRGLLDESESLRRQSINVVVGAFLDSLGEGPSLKDLAVAAAALWVSGTDRADRLLQELLGEPERRTHPSLLAVYAASALRRGRLDEAHRAIAAIDEAYSAETDPRRRAELAVNLAYLYFHSWSSQSRVAMRAGMAQAAEFYLKRAVGHAEVAYQLLVELTAQTAPDVVPVVEALEAYALNLWLYYTIEGGIKIEQARLAKLASSLMDYRSVPGCWQYRYDDTLARFYRLLARGEQDERRRAEYFGFARDSSDAALRESHGDLEVTEFRRRLSLDELALRMTAESDTAMVPA